jgi:hypothetical protein
MTEAFHVLPLAGGLFDQPAGYITRMEAVLRATIEQSEVDSKREAAKARAEARAKEQAG